MKRDILQELAKGKISPEEAQQIFDAVLHDGKMGLGEGVGMDNAEYTANCHGVGLPELAKWRKDGWPDECVVCGEHIDVPNFGWMAKELGPDQDHVLEHVQCPTTGRAKRHSAKRSARA